MIMGEVLFLVRRETFCPSLLKACCVRVRDGRDTVTPARHATLCPLLRSFLLAWPLAE
jgi:hypothetical protein